MTILYLILAALGLGFLIFIHELGHYFVARWVGIRVETFSIGFGRAVVRWEHKGVEWKVGWMPFGGFVRMAGEERSKDGSETRVEGGFLAAKPLHRIYVAAAGPIVNILFAIVAFAILWGVGGRERPYSQYSQSIGWLDLNSTLYQAGLRPGDRITAYDDYEVYTVKDHAYGPMLADGSVWVSGERLNEQTGASEPFRIEVATYADPDSEEKGLMTLGFQAPGQYLIFPGWRGEADPAKLPMGASGIEQGDRIVWVNGEPVFSLDEVKHILNDGRSLVTVVRDGTTFLARVPRLPVRELRMTEWSRRELGDWLYEAGGNVRLQQAVWIPYEINDQAVVEERLATVDPAREEQLFPRSPFSSREEPLQPGDRIVAIDGVPVSGASEVIARLQSPQTLVIVQRGERLASGVTTEEAQKQFTSTVPWSDLALLSSTIGTGNAESQRGGLVLLNPVKPMPYEMLLKQVGGAEEVQAHWREQMERAQSISNPTARERAIEGIALERTRLALGVPLQDREVQYNPGPMVLFGRVMGETGRTLQSLVVGDLQPKWLSGPVGIVQVMQYSWAMGAREALFWLGFISLNLAILNLLPIPILDGGNIVFSLWEMITRKPIRQKTMEKLVIPFFVLLVGFFVYVTYQDLARIFRNFF